MRARSMVLALWLLAGGASLAAAPPAKAAPPDKAEKKAAKDNKAATELKMEAGKGARVEGELTNDDPKDTARTGSYAKTYTVHLEGGKSYQIDMVTRGPRLDPYLRLLDPQGKQVAEDDDGGGFPNARILYKADKGGSYKIVATTYAPNMTGKYLLTVKVGSPLAAALAKLNTEFQTRAQALQREYVAAKTKEEKDKIEARFFEAMEKHNERVAAFAEKHAGEKDLGGQVAYTLAEALRSASEKAYQKKHKDRSAKLAKLSEELYERVAEEKDNPRQAQQAKDSLWELQHLAVGKKAPEIEAEDIDGKKFKLSDYRGKVIVLDFWGNW